MSKLKPLFRHGRVVSIEEYRKRRGKVVQMPAKPEPPKPAA